MIAMGYSAADGKHTRWKAIRTDKETSHHSDGLSPTSFRPYVLLFWVWYTIIVMFLPLCANHHTAPIAKVMDGIESRVEIATPSDLISGLTQRE